MPTPDPTTPARGGSSAGASSGAGTTFGPGLGPSLGASLAVHGAMIASLVFTLRLASPPMDRRGPSNFSARLETIEPCPLDEPAEPPAEVLPAESTPEERPLPELDDLVPSTPDPLSNVFVETPSVVPEPEPVINPFFDPHAVLEGVRIRPLERRAIEPPSIEPLSIEPPSVDPPAVEPDTSTDPDESVEPQKEPSTDSSGDLSPEPLADSCPPPVYPPAAERRGWKGTVVLLIDVAADGSVTDVRVEISSGYTVLDDAAVRAVERWRFTPGRTGGAAASATVRKPIQFGR